MKKDKSEVRTRRAILNLLKERGATDSKGLASALRLTPMAVRLHLWGLRKEKMVDYQEEARPLGRPAKLWKLAPQANRIFPDAHAELTVGLIEAMNQTFEQSGLDHLLQFRKKKQAENYAAKLDLLSPLKAKLRALAEIRTREGYMAEVKSLGKGAFLFIENHCPICSAAQTCLGFCSTELEVFQEVLGSGIHIEREEHILAGARRCAYRITIPLAKA